MRRAVRAVRAARDWAHADRRTSAVSERSAGPDSEASAARPGQPPDCVDRGHPVVPALCRACDDPALFPGPEPAPPAGSVRAHARVAPVHSAAPPVRVDPDGAPRAPDAPACPGVPVVLAAPAYRAAPACRVFPDAPAVVPAARTAAGPRAERCAPAFPGGARASPGGATASPDGPAVPGVPNEARSARGPGGGRHAVPRRPVRPERTAHLPSAPDPPMTGRTGPGSARSYR